jgi:DNA polymerase elongation subunit (family B)
MQKYIDDQEYETEKLFLLESYFDSKRSKLLLLYYNVNSDEIEIEEKNHLFEVITHQNILHVIDLVRKSLGIEPEIIEGEVYHFYISSTEYIQLSKSFRIDVFTKENKEVTKIFLSSPNLIQGPIFRNILFLSEIDIHQNLKFITKNSIKFFQFLKPNNIDSVFINAKELHLANKDQNVIKELPEKIVLVENLIRTMNYYLLQVQTINHKKRKIDSIITLNECISQITLIDKHSQEVQLWKMGPFYESNEFDKFKAEIIVQNSLKISKFEFYNERDMLEHFFKECEKKPIIITYEGDNIDLPILQCRSIYHELRHPIKRNQHFSTFSKSIHIQLKSVLSTSIINKLLSNNIETFVNNEHWFNVFNHNNIISGEDQDFNDITAIESINFCIKLANLLSCNNNYFLNLLGLLSQILDISILRITRFKSSKWIENLIHSYHLQKGVLIPDKSDLKKNNQISNDELTEPLIIESHLGIWWNVTVLDYCSLYPSLLLTNGLSYENINCEHETCPKPLPYRASNFRVCQERNGILSNLIENLIKDRTTLIKDDNYIKYNSLFKELLNQMIGLFSVRSFHYFAPNLAQAIRSLARKIMIDTYQFTKALNFKILYADTDSLFLHEITEKKIMKLQKWVVNEFQLKFEIQNKFRFIFFSSRKRCYFGITDDNKIVKKGLMGSKSNTPNYLMNWFNRTLELIQKNLISQDSLENTKLIIIANLKVMVLEINHNLFDKDDLAITERLSKPLESYRKFSPVAQAAIQLLDQNLISSSSQLIDMDISYIPLDFEHPYLISDKQLSSLFGTKVSISVKPVELFDYKIDDYRDSLLQFAESIFMQILQPLDISWQYDILNDYNIDQYY